jgi:hypothetical protein
MNLPATVLAQCELQARLHCFLLGLRDAEISVKEKYNL